MTNKLRWCQNCLSMSTRPRINFDERGFCNACRWMEKKAELDWSKRIDDLNKLILKESKKLVLLNEYRHSLISSVVTGKIRITEDML